MDLLAWLMTWAGFGSDETFLIYVDIEMVLKWRDLDISTLVILVQFEVRLVVKVKFLFFKSRMTVLVEKVIPIA